MSNNQTKLDATTPKDNRGAEPPLDMNDVEMVFGTPNSPNNYFVPDVHTIANERRTGSSPVANQNNNNVKNLNNINNKKTEAAEFIPPTISLLEPDIGRNQPPLAGPEIDDLDEKPTDHSQSPTTPFHGIDDGLLEPIDKTPDIFGSEGDQTEKEGEDGVHSTHDDGAGADEGKWLWPRVGDEPDYPYDGVNGFGTRFGIDDRPGSPLPGSIPDVNTYQQKKNLAQGMMDLALLSANANQLRYVIESSSGGHPYFYSSIVFISLSIILQVAVGVGLIMNSRYNVKDEKDICKADKINNMTVLGIFLVTIVNVFISAFSVAPTSTGLPAATLPVQQAG